MVQRGKLYTLKKGIREGLVKSTGNKTDASTNLLLVLLERGLSSLPHSHSDASNLMVVGAALKSRKHSLVDFVFVVIHNGLSSLVDALLTWVERGVLADLCYEQWRFSPFAGLEWVITRRKWSLSVYCKHNQPT